MKSALILVLMLFVAGCVTTDYGSQKTVQTTAPATVATTVQASDVSISFVELPDSIKPNSKFVVKWKVDSNQGKNITHTAVHYGYESRPGEFSLEKTPQETGYAELTQEFASGKHIIPAIFNSTISPKQSPIYLRAHVIIDGKNYWTPEKQIKEVMAEAATTTTGSKPRAP
ncbi:MAG: hypothetical protein HYT72_03620 [Candidatus Aenigmarchaeota archaeon]|nr:hypothetical protein [Candidatus Aenigmarchaeota archaeon]